MLFFSERKRCKCPAQSIYQMHRAKGQSTTAKPTEKRLTSFSVFTSGYFSICHSLLFPPLFQVAFPFEARCFNELYGLWFKSSLSCARYLGFILLRV